MTATENKKTEASESTDEITKLLDASLFEHEVFKHEVYEYEAHETYYDPIAKVKKIRKVRRRGIS